MQPNLDSDDTSTPIRIFVFGSNTAGRHGAGAAKYAVEHHGAQYGVGEGITGFSYALPTKDDKIQTRTLEEVRESVRKFIRFAEANSHMEFYVTEIGCGLAGFTQVQIAPMFYRCLFLKNVKLPKKFLDVIAKGNYNSEKISFDF